MRIFTKTTEPLNTSINILQINNLLKYYTIAIIKNIYKMRILTILLYKNTVHIAINNDKTRL